MCTIGSLYVYLTWPDGIPDSDGSSGRDLSASAEDDLWSRVVGLESKMDAVVKAVTDQKRPETDTETTSQPSAKGKGTDFMVQSLHNKVSDKFFLTCTSSLVN